MRVKINNPPNSLESVERRHLHLHVYVFSQAGEWRSLRRWRSRRMLPSAVVLPTGWAEPQGTNWSLPHHLRHHPGFIWFWKLGEEPVEGWTTFLHRRDLRLVLRWAVIFSSFSFPFFNCRTSKSTFSRAEFVLDNGNCYILAPELNI